MGAPISGTMPLMKTPRRNPAAVELNGELYVIGDTRAMKD